MFLYGHKMSVKKVQVDFQFDIMFCYILNDILIESNINLHIHSKMKFTTVANSFIADIEHIFFNK